MKTNIVVTLRLPGLHAWPGVKNTPYNDKVGYLAAVHRHMFWFKIEKSVSHADRDIEIIDLRNKIEIYLKERYWNENTGCLEFGSMSCEMIASELVKEFQLVSCEVLEDGENGAVAYYQPKPTNFHVGANPIKPAYGIIDEIEHNIVFGEKLGSFINEGQNITFICGYLCSGKTTLGWAYCEGLVKSGIYKSVGYLEVSSIVKKILNEHKRSELQNHPELDNRIIAEINKMSQKYEYLIVNGARQVSILEAFPKASSIWLDVPEKLRFDRYQNSSKDDNKSFDGFAIANTKDLDLGLQEVKKYIFTKQHLKHTK